METRSKLIASTALVFMLFSCNSMPSKNHGPIVLGDSSTIVTETDPDKLHDLVADLQPVIRHNADKDSDETAGKNTAPEKTADTTPKNTAVAAPPPAPVQPQPAGNAMKADFGNVSFTIPYVTAKLSGRANLLRANDAIFSFVSGNITGNVIQVPAIVSKVSQRYQTVIAVKNELGTLPLEALTTTTSWEALKGVNNVYKITGLDAKNLEFAAANRNAIRNAVVKSARRHRMNHRKMLEWEESVRNVRTSNQKPLFVILRSVMWKIDGKDAGGHSFSKQIRLDMPL